MDPVTMMVASIGVQFFTQHATSKKNAEIQEKQREFQKAAAEHDFERMRKLQAESARLALELEAEVHKERVEDINNNYDALLENFAHSFAIQNWPLNVLPFVMKGESFGSLFNGTTQSVNMHCILTPSNCEWFNAMFYDDIDLRLEAELNNNWNAQTTHPVVYYGGGWNRRTMRHGISVPDEINLVDIDLLKVKLKNIPVVVITPYFDYDYDSDPDSGSWLQFRVQLWGMGKDSDEPFRIYIPHGNGLKYSKRIFSYDYNKDIKDGISSDFINTTIEEFVPYLESLIGFIADKYFWGVYSLPPRLPELLEKATSNINIYNNQYIAFAQDKLCLNKIPTLKDFHSYIEYIKSIKNYVDQKQIEDIKKQLLKVFHETYIPSQNETVNTRSYEDVVTYVNAEQQKEELYEWSDQKIINNEYVDFINIDRLDISTYIDEFRNYIDGHGDRFNLNSISLYIKHEGYKLFELLVYDADGKKYLNTKDGFSYKITTNRPLHFRKIKYIFKNNDPGVIICRYDRLDKLQNELTEEETLIF